MASVVAGGVMMALQRMTPKGKVMMELRVEYTAPYAIYVHEDLTMNHPRGGQAKYLEQPMRTEARTMQRIIMTAVKNKDGLEEGLRRAARHVIEVSRKLVPVDTGFLRESGFFQILG